MKFSYNWLKELSKTKKDVNEIAELFMTHSFEVEGIEDLSKGLENVVIGKVLTKEKHPDADRLNVATVDVGKDNDGELQIVCGAPNLEVGQKVPVALVGAVLPDGKDEFEIKKSKIRGVESNGMICAEDELGIGTEHEGIMILDSDAVVGSEFAEYAQLDDQIIDIDILPNRGHDCLSYQGIANEISALEDSVQTYTHPNPFPEGEGVLHVTIDTNKCSRYIGVIVDDVEIKESPKWMQDRLKASDIQPINNIVDITNYVMLETGQPLHAFDAQAVNKITVRQAKNDEKIRLLDEQELKLCQDDIVITDGNKAIALAGVMGGNDSAISNATKNIILEAASFDATSIRFTQRKYNLQTDAAYRFERNIDPNIAEIAAARAAELFVEFASATIVGVTDIYPEPVIPWTIKLFPQKVEKLLGINISQEDIKEILQRLNMDVDIVSRETMIVTVPTVRIDLQSQEDLIEEIGRMYGYDKITPKPLTSDVQTPQKNETRFFERVLKDIFVYGGFDEVRGYSFYANAEAQAIGLDDEKHIALMNPMNPNQSLMRRTLAPSLLSAVKKNFSYFDKIHIFEIGRIYDPVINSLPDEKLILGAVVASKDVEGSQFFEMKGIIETLLDRLNIGKYYLDTVFDENAQHIPNLHPSRRALIRMENGDIIGWLGEIDKKASRYFGLKKNRAVVCELDIDTMLSKVQSENFFEPLAKFPFISRDLSMLIGQRVRVGDVERIIYDTGGELVKDVDLFDLYRNPETGERSMAFHIIFGHNERTLKASEVDEKIQKIIMKLEKNLDIEIRR